MPWQKLTPPKPLDTHRCFLPNIEQIREVKAGSRSEWQCETCLRIWRLQGFSVNGLDSNDVKPVWVDSNTPIARAGRA